jgi:uncharacterized membrane protein YeaQ/YmgE (transglycosylase-associated protein family)
MGDAGVGWIAAIIVGGIAGWLAEQFMKSNMGLIMNIVLGIVGAAIASAILSYFGIALGGMGRLPSFRLHRRSLAALDRPGDTARLKPSEARSAGGVPTVGKRDKWPSHTVVVRCFREPGIRRRCGQGHILGCSQPI